MRKTRTIAVLALAALGAAGASQQLSTLKGVTSFVKSKAALDAPRPVKTSALKGVADEALARNMGFRIDPKDGSAPEYKDKRSVFDATPLVEAVLFGNLEGARLLLDKGAGVNQPVNIHTYVGEYKKAENALGSPFFSYTPLMVAALKRDRPMAELLLGAGADLNFRLDGYHRSALELAVDVGAGVDFLRFLLESGADAKARDQALLVATARDRREAVAYLLGAGADPDVYSLSDEPLTPLLVAVAWLNVEPARLLVEAGADPNLPGRHLPERTRELVALKYFFNNAGSAANHYECSNLGVGNESGPAAGEVGEAFDPESLRTPLEAALRANAGEALSLGNAYWADRNKRRAALVDIILAAKPKLDARDGLDSPLMLAAYYGSPALVDRLLALGADLSYENARGEDAFTAVLKAATGPYAKKGEAELKACWYPIVSSLVMQWPDREARLAYLARCKGKALAVDGTKGYGGVGLFTIYLDALAADL